MLSCAIVATSLPIQKTTVKAQTIIGMPDTQAASQFYVELSRVQIEKQNEGGDDPYFAVIGFRSRYRTPNSTETKWNEEYFNECAQTTCEVGSDMHVGDNAFVSPGMGRVSFPNVGLFSFNDLTYGKFPEVMGALIIAMESDACGWDVPKAAFKAARDTLQQKLKELIEEGGLNPTNLDKAALAGIGDAIKSNALNAAKDKVKSNIDLLCAVDPEDFIDYHFFLYSPVVPSIGQYIPTSSDSKMSWGIVDDKANRIHEWEISGGNPIVFEGDDAKWSATVIVGVNPDVPVTPVWPKATQTISKVFLPIVDQSAIGPRYVYTDTTVSVLQYNVQFLTPWNEGALPGHWPNTDDRAQSIAKAIACYDIVGLNETINDVRRATLLKTMNEAATSCGKPKLMPGASYIASLDGPDVPKLNLSTLKDVLDSVVAIRQRPAREQGMPIAGNEVTLISRFPIMDTNTHIYQARANEDSLAAKGVLHARVQTGPNPSDQLDVFVTHLQSGDDDAQLSQIHELAIFMAEHTNPNRPALLLGDFNIDGLTVKQSEPAYSYLINTLGLLKSGVMLNDIGKNLSTGTNEKRDERIDYIFASPNGFLTGKAPVRVRLFDGNGWGTLSDHAGVEAELTLRKTSLIPPSLRPDLVVDKVEVSPSGIRLTIQNIGDAPVVPGENFWVDIYLNPRVAPTSVNQTWQDMGEYGSAWAVVSSAFPLPPGGRLVLELFDHYYAPTFSRYPEFIPTGSVVYAQVDSAKKASGFGGVLEHHEENNLAYNNIVSITTSVDISTGNWISQSVSPVLTTTGIPAVTAETQLADSTPRQ
jgi:endonuclease/exonuclease/phosphatase family metal-dependent hydrolase